MTPHTTPLATLVEWIDRILEGRGILNSPGPWIGWLLVVLMRHRVRQAWHRYIVNTRLRDQEANGGEGQVPGLPGWKFRFHGIGCCLTGPYGEEIDVDRRDEHAAIIDPWFFARRVRTVQAFSVPEARLWRWMPAEGLIVASLAELRGAGAIVYSEGDHFFELAAPLEKRVKAISELDFTNHSVADRAMKSLADGDAPYLLADHRLWLRTRALDRQHASDVLSVAAALLETNELRDVCLELMSGPIDLAAGFAIAALPKRGKTTIDAVEAVLDRISPTEDHPYPAYQAIEYLLARDAFSPRLIKHFRKFSTVKKTKGYDGNPFLGRYAILALCFLPWLAMKLVRRALRSSMPCSVIDIAAVLCTTGQAWCVRELTSALEENSGDHAIAEALRQCKSTLAHRAAERLYATADDPNGIGFMFQDVQQEAVTAMFAAELERVEGFGEPIRKMYPATWSG